MSRRFHDRQPFSANVITDLGADASHHIGRVLRMRVGDEIVVFNGDGGEWSARIDAISKKAVSVLPLQFHEIDRCPAIQVTCLLPPIKGERMDYALQKATELGAARFQLLQTEHGDVRLSGERLEKKLGHWQRVVISACEQCGMNRVPEVLPPISFAEAIANTDASLKLIGQPGAPALSAERLHDIDSIALLTGPEGGFSDDELEQARAAGFQGFSLGERVLRAETAPVAVLGMLLGLAGG